LRVSNKNLLVLALVVSILAVGAYGIGPLTREWGSNITAETGLYESVLGGLNYDDINGDGIVDILVCRRKGFEDMTDRIVCLKGTDGSIQWIYPPPDQDNLPGDPMCIPAIGDLDGDGKKEIVAIGRNSWVDCIDGDGNQIWRFTPDAGSDNSATIFDIDGDGKKEVLFATGGSGLVYCLNYDGSLRWKYQMVDGTNSGPTVWDVDRDGQPEVLVPDSNGKLLYCLSNTGVEEWRFATEDKPGQTTAAVADIDRDGEYEILLLVPDELRLYCLTFYGTEKWRFDLNPTAALTGYVSEHVALGDVDGDGYIEAFVSDLGLGEAGPVPELFCVKYDGTLKWTAEAIAFTTLIGDFDGDGKMDIAGGRGFTQIMILDANGQYEYIWDQAAVDPNIPVDPNFGAPLWGPSDVTQIIGDLDGDGKVEWAMETDPDSMIYCFTADGAYNPDNMIWTRGARTEENNAVIPMPEDLLLLLAGVGALAALSRKLH